MLRRSRRVLVFLRTSQPIKCQSRLWSQRGTKVNGSHRGDHLLLRPTWIEIATKSYATLQAMAPTNIKGSSNLLTPLINKYKFQISQGHTSYKNEEYCNTEVHGGGGLELVNLAREPESSRPKPCASLKKNTNLTRSPLLVALVRRKMTVVTHQLFPQKCPGSRLNFSLTGVQPPPDSSTVELPSAFVESGVYPLDRALPGSPRQCSLPLACRHPPEGHQHGGRKGRTSRSTIGGGGDVTNLSPFWVGTALEQPLPGTYLTNHLVK